MIFDTGDTYPVIPINKDIVYVWKPKLFKVNGVSSTTQFTGTGIVQWTLKDDFGNTTMMEVVEFLIPSDTVRLFRPQDLLSKNIYGRYKLYWDKSVLNTNNTTITVHYDKISHLPVIKFS